MEKSFNISIFKDFRAKDYLIYGITYFILTVPILLNYFPNIASPNTYFANISYPFKDGKYLIMNGGANPFKNNHYFNKYQRFALDIVKVCDENYFKNTNEKEKFCSWSQPVLAVCKGIIEEVNFSSFDNNPGSKKFVDPRGNFIRLKCDEGFTVLYAHLKEMSQKIKINDEVVVSQPIGEIGSSGNADEPHLHIQVNLNREPLKINFNGRFYETNDIIQI